MRLFHDLHCFQIEYLENFHLYLKEDLNSLPELSNLTNNHLELQDTRQSMKKDKKNQISVLFHQRAKRTASLEISQG